MKLFFLTLFIIIFSLIDPINMYGNENPRIKSELETKYQYCNHKGRVTYLDKIDCYEVRKSTDDIFKSLIGLCDNEGNEIIPPKYDLIYTYYLEDYKFCKVKVDEHNGIYSLSKKKEIVPPIFDEITLDHKEAYDGELKEYPKFYVKKNDKWGLYCSLLGELVPVAYDKVDHYDTSYCKVSNDERTSIFDLISKEEVVPLKYDNVSLLTGNLVKYSIDNKWGLFSIDKQKELTEAKYDYISTFFNVNGYLTCETNNKKGILNNLGTEIIPPSYSEINIFGDSIAIVIDSLEMDKKHNITKNGKWGAFNLKDNKLIISPQYDFISGNTISENIILCNTGGQAVDLYNVSGGKWGGIDTDGNIVIPFKYESISSFKNGVAQVVIDGAVGLLKNPISDSNLIIESNIHSSIDKDIPIVNKINDETFAFIIANEDYPHIDASYSKRDGNSFAEYCERRLGIPKKNISLYNDATFGTMKSIIAHCSDIAEVYEGSASFIFYFAGIGFSKNQPSEYYILPVDFSISNIKSTSVNLRELISSFNNMNLSKFILVTDCTFNGADRTGNNITEDRGIKIKQSNDITCRNFLWIYNSPSSNKPIIDNSQGHGILTYSLLEILQKNSKISLRQLIDNLNRSVQKVTLDKYNEVSSPIIINNLDKNLSI